MSHSFPLPTFFLRALLLLLLLLLLTTAQAQISTLPATPNACNLPLKYPCFGTDLCCPLPAVCIPDSSSGSVRYNCIDAAGFPVDGGAGSISVGGGVSPTMTARSGGVGPIVISTPPPVVPGGNGGSAPAGGVVSTPLSLLPVPITSSISVPVTGIARFGTSTLPVPGSTVPGGVAGGNTNGPVVPVTPSTIIATSFRLSASSAMQSGDGDGGAREDIEDSSNQLINNGGVGSVDSESGSASNNTTGNGSVNDNGNRNGTTVFTGAVAPRNPIGLIWSGGAWGSVIALVIIAVVGAIVVE